VGPFIRRSNCAFREGAVLAFRSCKWTWITQQLELFITRIKEMKRSGICGVVCFEKTKYAKDRRHDRLVFECQGPAAKIKTHDRLQIVCTLLAEMKQLDL